MAFHKAGDDRDKFVISSLPNAPSACRPAFSSGLAAVNLFNAAVVAADGNALQRPGLSQSAYRVIGSAAAVALPPGCEAVSEPARRPLGVTGPDRGVPRTAGL